jgi:hypothetical protein
LLGEVIEATGLPLAMFEKAVLLGLAEQHEETLTMQDEEFSRCFPGHPSRRHADSQEAHRSCVAPTIVTASPD